MRTKNFLGPLILSVVMIGASPLDEADRTDSGPIVVRNEYWAKPGMEDAVYQHRLYASEVRARLGLYRGRVMRRIDDRPGASAANPQPDVVWECEYPNREAREADLRALDATGEFEPVMAKMGTLIEKFDRSVWQLGAADE